MQMVQSSGQQPSKELLMSVLQDPQFQQLLARQAKSASIMQSVYPKVFVFGAKDFHLLAAVTGVATHDDLLGLVKKVVPAAASAASTPGDDSASADDPLSQAAPADAETAPADAASATPTPPAAPNGTAPATAAPAAPQSGKQP